LKRRLLIRLLLCGPPASAVLLGACGGAHATHPSSGPGGADASSRSGPAHAAPTPARAPVATVPGAPYAVGIRILRLRDPHRTVALPDGRRVPRTLLTIVRYPALGKPVPGERMDATPARVRGPFPLVVFGHGFAVTPAIYAHLLHSWTRAGYVVAAPVFPLGSAGAPGGPDESDLPNQPADMSLVISRMVADGASATGPLAGMVDPGAIAVAGQSDGGDAALATAFDPRSRDRRVKAAVILSGAEIPMNGAFAFPARGPALLAVQGSADTVNLPSETALYFAAAPRPKFLLRLAGAEHLPPYTVEQPQLRTVERASTAFLDVYLRHRAGASFRLRADAEVPGVASLAAFP